MEGIGRWGQGYGNMILTFALRDGNGSVGMRYNYGPPEKFLNLFHQIFL